MKTDNATSDSVSGLDNAAIYIKTFSLVFYCLITVAGTVGNGLVIYVTGFRMKRTVNSLWFLNLAIADFLFTTFLIFSTVSLYRDHEWPFGNFMCKLNTFVNVINMFASIFLLMAISLDRCLSVWVVVWAQNKRTVRKAQIICAVIWVTAGICSIPYATFREVTVINGTERCLYLFKMKEVRKLILNTFRFVVGFFIPFLVILVSYVAIAVRARHLQRTRKRRFHRITIAIIFAFFLCWLPFHILVFIEFAIGENSNFSKIVPIVGPLTVSLAYMNSCLNPILYVFMCEEFQKKLKQSICLVLESALAEDHLSLMSPRSLQSHFLPMSQKSGSITPLQEKCAVTSPTFTSSKVGHSESTGTQSNGEVPDE
ncbi:C3a anaphylatoxin chemotactic receptor-like [Kryptolebias marmoratus]|uniref:C3a anaphylatoxin chemotactic receptor-like n=1 Tax=Kryptolebias marmoratus TaxID=37003 RepID=UPI0007F86A0A|nr:C3a anaphylatoxin chemotactic receptor-like [Kryptolebias marmoratus]